MSDDEPVNLLPDGLPGYLRAARTRVGVVSPHAAVLRVAGADRISFLHRLLTCDVKSLPVGGAAAGLFLTAKGKVVADFVLAVLPDRVELIAPIEGIQGLQQGLSKFVIADDVVIEQPAERSVLSALGPSAEQVLARMLLGHVPSHAAFETDALGAPLLVVRRTRAGLPGVDLVTDRELARHIRHAALDAARDEGGGPLFGLGLEALRVENGVPALGAEFGAETLPQEAGLGALVSFTKGCFLGQEPVARLETQGHTNRGLAGLLPESLPAPGDPVFAGGKEVGRVTSAVSSPTLGRPIALSLLRHEASAPGTAVEVRNAAGPIRAAVTSLPFVV